MGHSWPLFLYFRLFCKVDSKQMFFFIKVCWWLDSNCEPLVSEATALQSFCTLQSLWFNPLVYLQRGKLATEKSMKLLKFNSNFSLKESNLNFDIGSNFCHCHGSSKCHFPERGCHQNSNQLFFSVIAGWLTRLGSRHCRLQLYFIIFWIKIGKKMMTQRFVVDQA